MNRVAEALGVPLLVPPLQRRLAKARSDITRVVSRRSALPRHRNDQRHESSNVDLDLYLPMKVALKEVFFCLSRGGILVADDCQPNINYDGALQAFTEFTKDHKLPLRIDLNRLGVAVKA